MAKSKGIGRELSLGQLGVNSVSMFHCSAMFYAGCFAPILVPASRICDCAGLSTPSDSVLRECNERPWWKLPSTKYKHFDISTIKNRLGTMGKYFRILILLINLIEQGLTIKTVMHY